MQNMQMENQAAKKERNTKDKGLMKISEAMADYRYFETSKHSYDSQQDMKEERFTGT